MSIFYEEFMGGRAQRLIEQGLENKRNSARREFVRAHLGQVDSAIESIFPIIYDFSHIIFVHLGFYSMQPPDVEEAWSRVRRRINPQNLHRAIFAAPSGEDVSKRFLDIFDFAEVISLEGGILARVNNDQKVLPIHMMVAFSSSQLRCPYKIYGIC